MLELQGYVSPREAERVLDRSAGRVQQLMALGRLRTIQTPLGRLIERASLDEVADALQRRAQIRESRGRGVS